jgi:two-component system, OmpR family, sensor kinase
MSSSPRTRSPRTRLAGWSLRARLVATVLGLLALICVIVGVTTEVVTRHLLYAAKDQQLVASSGRGGRIFGEGPAHPPDFEGCTTDTNLFPPGQAAGTVAAHIQRDGPVCAQLLTDNGRQVLSSALNTTFMAVPVDGRPHTVRLADLGDYRVIATHAPNGDGDTVITALPLSDVEHTLRAVILTEVCVSLGGLLLAGAIGTAMVRGELRPLRRVAATASRVSELPLERGDVALSVRVPTVDTDPRTEVGQVGAALNRMLGHIAGALRVRQASETRMRQFLADASHELRTPLAAIRGYAELSRRMDGQVPPDLAHAMRRVESEARRMTALVEDLLLLARLDSGRPLEREPVDLSGLVVDAVSDAHAAGPDHQWHLSVPEDPVVVTGDPLRLHQVLANLLANAVPIRLPVPGSPSVCPLWTVRRGSWWPTTGRAFRRTYCPRCSTGSPARTPRAPGPPAAPASASRSSRLSWKPTTAP